MAFQPWGNLDFLDYFKVSFITSTAGPKLRLDFRFVWDSFSHRNCPPHPDLLHFLLILLGTTLQRRIIGLVILQRSVVQSVSFFLWFLRPRYRQKCPIKNRQNSYQHIEHIEMICTSHTYQPSYDTSFYVCTLVLIGRYLSAHR